MGIEDAVEVVFAYLCYYHKKEMKKYVGIYGMHGVFEIIVKTIEKSLGKTAIKKVPVASIFAGLAFGC